MQNIVIAKPYKFVPPVRRNFWPWVFRPFLRPYLSRTWGVEQVEIMNLDPPAGSHHLGRASMVITPNHCRPCDPMVIGLLGAGRISPCI